MTESARESSSAENLVSRFNRLRFQDLGEVFFARLLFGLVEDPLEDRTLTIPLHLGHLFTQESLADVHTLANAEFDETNSISEMVCSGLNAAFGTQYASRVRRVRAIDHYLAYLRTRLGHLRDGDDTGLPALIEHFRETDYGRFEVTFRVRQLREGLPEALKQLLDLPAEILSELSAKIPPHLFRIDYSKELDFLRAFLDARQRLTGERELQFTTRDIPLRHALMTNNGVPIMLAPGTFQSSDRVLLPMFLEATGDLDITHVGLCSSPKEPDNVEVKFTVRRPSRLALFGVAAEGLRPEDRRALTEIQLSTYLRIHRALQQQCIYVGRPQLESHFAELAALLLRKIGFCLEEPSFLTKPLTRWLSDRKEEGNCRVEEEFVAPFIYERLYDAFGDRIQRKPNKIGGQVDLLFEELPIELKVRRGEAPALVEIIDDSYRPASQAGAYAAQTRLGIVVAVDLPSGEPTVTNLDSCVRVMERNVGTSWPTCIVVFIFHCHHPRPSSLT